MEKADRIADWIAHIGLIALVAVVAVGLWPWRDWTLLFPTILSLPLGGLVYGLLDAIRRFECNTGSAPMAQSWPTPHSGSSLKDRLGSAFGVLIGVVMFGLWGISILADVLAQNWGWAIADFLVPPLGAVRGLLGLAG